MRLNNDLEELVDNALFEQQLTQRIIQARQVEGIRKVEIGGSARLHSSGSHRTFINNGTSADSIG